MSNSPAGGSIITGIIVVAAVIIDALGIKDGAMLALLPLLLPQTSNAPTLVHVFCEALSALTLSVY